MIYDILLQIYYNFIFAGMAELADALDSGSSVLINEHAGSSPVACTKKSKLILVRIFFIANSAVGPHKFEIYENLWGKGKTELKGIKILAL